MSRTESLSRSLRALQSSLSDVEASAVVSVDGLIIASALPQGIEEARIAAMSATLLSMGARTAHELQRGGMDQLFVKGEHGFAIVSGAGKHAVLLVLVRKEAKLGLIFFELRRTTDDIAAILG